VDSLLAEAVEDPDFAATLAELTESLKAKLPRDLHDEYSQLYTLKTLVADARSLLAGDLT
jgi:exonuclease SbcD